jgi:hypothetical protein
MLTILAVLGGVALAGYVGGFRVGRQRRPYWAAPPTVGHVVEVFTDGGLCLWQSVGASETAASIADSWCFPGYAVLRYGPGDRVKDVVCGADLLEDWESMWPADPPLALRRTR